MGGASDDYTGERIGIKVTQEDSQQVLEQDSKGYASDRAYIDEMQQQFGLNPDDLRNEAEYRIGLEKIATQGIQVQEAETLLERVQQGEGFDTLLQEHSSHLFGKDKSGQMGWVDEYDPFQPQEIMEAARELSSGDVAGPIAVNEGYAVIFVQDIRLEAPANEQQVRQQIRRSLALAQVAPLEEVEKSLRDKYGVRTLPGKDMPSISL
ncbi:UNVERIFIED_CONTAM: foldase protein PrsA [Paenibacillus sp. PvR008]